ncbi:hypothetical protein AK830_g4269 [Neonectria ditissima]|uniref:Uncharacterized protein n=1 Tax=Neonectria ditissima TaxID=78410 RepID=A0A0P7BP57_9HYPO|nr:hypothetical protein AK830_g4269 [Neonectria ditissima]
MHQIKMCQELVSERRHVCWHLFEVYSLVSPTNNCGFCGIVSEVHSMPGGMEKTPCDDCLESGIWVWSDEEWKEDFEAEMSDTELEEDDMELEEEYMEIDYEDVETDYEDMETEEEDLDTEDEEMGMEEKDMDVSDLEI